MRIRYTTWSLAVLLVGSAAMSFGAPLPRSGAGDSSAAAKAKTAPKKSSTEPVHATKTSAKRRAAVHPISTRAHLPLAPSASRISEIQAALSRQGAYQGEPNGRWDGTTVDAMKQFQTDHGLNPSGKIDALTLQKLGLGSQVSGLGAPVPASVPQASAADSSQQTEQHP
jgi:peptidoglycan hydrolase-like protein with peptidoglycan-binding domain